MAIETRYYQVNMTKGFRGTGLSVLDAKRPVIGDIPGLIGWAAYGDPANGGYIAVKADSSLWATVDNFKVTNTKIFTRVYPTDGLPVVGSLTK